AVLYQFGGKFKITSNTSPIQLLEFFKVLCERLISPRIRIRFVLENARIFSKALREQLQRYDFEGLSRKVDRTP
ncbi:9451_t:CDS:2, partial [Gigaspora rosea]